MSIPELVATFGPVAGVFLWLYINGAKASKADPLADAMDADRAARAALASQIAAMAHDLAEVRRVTQDTHGDVKFLTGRSQK